jgi:hypothetical protein
VQGGRWSPPRHRGGPASREVPLPSRVFSDLASSRVGFGGSPRALGGFPLDSRVFARPAARRDQSLAVPPLLSFPGLFRVLRSPSCCASSLAGRNRHWRPRRFLLRGFFPFSVSPLGAAAHPGSGFPSPTGLRLQVFSTSWRLTPLRACRPYFVPDPLMGFPFRALLLPCSRSPSPAPLPSCRSSAAFRRLRGVVYITGFRSAVLSATPF